METYNNKVSWSVPTGPSFGGHGDEHSRAIGGEGSGYYASGHDSHGQHGYGGGHGGYGGHDSGHGYDSHSKDKSKDDKKNLAMGVAAGVAVGAVGGVVVASALGKFHSCSHCVYSLDANTSQTIRTMRRSTSKLHQSDNPTHHLHHLQKTCQIVPVSAVATRKTSRRLAKSMRRPTRRLMVAIRCMV